MLAEAKEAGQILDEEQLAFLADTWVPDGQVVQIIIPNNTAFQTEDLDTYDSDCDDISNAKAVLMANISNYGYDVISEVPLSETYLNDMENQNVLAMQDLKQPPAMEFTDNEIHSDSNIISKPSDALPVKIEAPQELLKISLVNETLKKHKFHLGKFDNVVKIRTTPNARIEGEWGFEHTKAVFNNEIILFLKSLKDIFNMFDRDILNEIMEVQTVFDQMEVVVQQSSIDKQYLEIAKNELVLENDRLLQQIMSQDVILTVINSISLIGDTVNMDGNRKESCNLKAKLLKSQNVFNDLLKSHSQLEKHFISLECSIQLNQENFQKHESCDNQNALEIPEFLKNIDLKARLHDKDSTICKLEDIIKSLRENSKEENVNYDYVEIEKKMWNWRINKGKEIVDIAAPKPSANTIVPGMFKLDLEPLALSAKKVAVTPKNKVKKVRFMKPLTSSSNIKQVELSNTTNSNTPVLSPTGLKCSTSNCGTKPLSNKKNDRISQTPSRNLKNKVEAQPRNVNKKNRVVKPISNVDVKHSILKANSEPICATCQKSMFDGVHNMCLLDFVKNLPGASLLWGSSGVSSGSGVEVVEKARK
nr:hypothetical protein [Tanacetum cinerariifolium]